MAYNATIRLTGIEKHIAMWIYNNNKKKLWLFFLIREKENIYNNLKVI